MNLIERYEKMAEKIVHKFVKRYFGKDCTIAIITIRRVIGINDYFFDFDFMVDALKLKATKIEVFEYYDFKLEERKLRNKNLLNFKVWVQYYRGFSA